MRKLFLMLAVLLIASVAYAADATVYCTVDGNEVTVSYTASAEANIPRAFGLDIQLDNGEAIDGVTVLSTDYWVTPGSYPGTDPLGDPCDSTDTLPGLDSNGITIEMGSLHSPPEVSSPNAPALAGDLISFTVTGECNVAISGNAARGKVVLYDATNEDDGRDVVYTGCEVAMGCQCLGDVTTNNTGIPAPGQPFDPNLLDGQNGLVSIADLQACVNAIKNEPGFSRPVEPLIQCLDVTTSSTGIPAPGQPFDPNLLDGPNGFVSIADLQAIVNAIKDEPGFSRGCIPPPAP
jgi:phosphoribosylcarboxyaminoimidazole (NCAIR) mutase